jgi:hypothetical protein
MLSRVRINEVPHNGGYRVFINGVMLSRDQVEIVRPIIVKRMGKNISEGLLELEMLQALEAAGRPMILGEPSE